MAIGMCMKPCLHTGLVGPALVGCAYLGGMKRILIKQDLLTNYTQCFPPQGRTCTCLCFNLHSRAPLLQLQLINLILNTLLLMQFPALLTSV